MSAKRSWDVVRREPAKKEEPKARATPRVAPAPVDIRRAPRPVAKPKPRTSRDAAERNVSTPVRISTRNVENPRGGKPQRAVRQPLKLRRKEERKRFGLLLAIFVFLILAGILYVLWLPILRIQVVQADSPSGQELEAIAKRDMSGSYAFILPKSSIFLVPQKQIRADILAAHPEIEALSISAKGLNMLTIHTVERATAFWWCGTAPDTQEATCYDTNAAGLIFEPAKDFSTSSTAVLRVYAPVNATSTDTSYPLGASITNTKAIPDALRFVKAIKGLGANVVSLALRDDEGDLYTQNNTRITYVLGKEQPAATLAATAFPQLPLNDGTLEYVDLRFEGKVYFKKK